MTDDSSRPLIVGLPDLPWLDEGTEERTVRGYRGPVHRSARLLLALTAIGLAVAGLAAVMSAIDAAPDRPSPPGVETPARS